MKNGIVFALFFFVVPCLGIRALQAEDIPSYLKESIVIKKNLGGHEATVTAQEKPFVAVDHQINKDLHGMITEIDGKPFLGTDGSLPRSELVSLNVSFGGKQVHVPKKFLTNCFDPNLGKNYFHVTIGDDLQSVYIFMSASDGAGAYEIIWVVHQNGTFSRLSASQAWLIGKDIHENLDIDTGRRIILQ